MNSLEEKLRTALRRQDPPPGFEERVLSRIPAPSPGWRGTLASYFRMPALRWTMAGIIVCCLILNGTVQHQREQRLRAEGERAKAQVLQALHMTSVKLNTVRRKVNDIGHRTAQPSVPAGDEGTKTKG
jgi:hypothetical protein